MKLRLMFNGRKNKLMVDWKELWGIAMEDRQRRASGSKEFKYLGDRLVRKLKRNIQFLKITDRRSTMDDLSEWFGRS